MPRLDGLIYQIHAAGTCQEGWAEALAGIRETLYGQLATLAKVHFSSGHSKKLLISPPCEAFTKAYATEHSVRNPWLLSSLDYQPGRIMTGEELLRPEELLRSDFYQRFLQNYDLFHRLCGVLLRDQEYTYYLAIYRSRQQPTFEDSDKALLNTLLPHFTLAFARYRELLHARSFQQAIYRVVDRWTSAVFLVDENAQMLFKNRAAGSLLEQRSGLLIDAAHLKAASRTENRALLEAIQDIASAPGSTPADAVKIITIANITDDTPLVVTIRPVALAGANELAEDHRIAVLVVNNPDYTHDVQSCPFGRIYQLTPAQARLTSLILAGHSLVHAAQQLQVSENTVRSHLKQIFLKTDTHSQMSLVHRHARVCTD